LEVTHHHHLMHQVMVQQNHLHQHHQHMKPTGSPLVQMVCTFGVLLQIMHVEILVKACQVHLLHEIQISSKRPEQNFQASKAKLVVPCVSSSSNVLFG
jgi:hypothetical protein